MYTKQRLSSARESSFLVSKLRMPFHKPGMRQVELDPFNTLDAIGVGYLSKLVVTLRCSLIKHNLTKHSHSAMKECASHAVLQRSLCCLECPVTASCDTRAERHSRYICVHMNIDERQSLVISAVDSRSMSRKTSRNAAWVLTVRRRNRNGSECKVVCLRTELHNKKTC